MENNQTAPALKTFRVYADCIRRVYQEIDARDAGQAYRAAKLNPELWDFCDEHEDNRYEPSSGVQDLQTGEFVDVPGERAGNANGDLLDVLKDVNDSLAAFYETDRAAAGQHFGAFLKGRMEDAIAKAEGR